MESQSHVDPGIQLAIFGRELQCLIPFPFKIITEHINFGLTPKKSWSFALNHYVFHNAPPLYDISII